MNHPSTTPYSPTRLSLLRRPMVPTMLFGVALLLLGLAATTYVVLVESGPEVGWHDTVHRLAVNAITVGVVLLVYAGLRRKGRSIEEAYRLGYDVGFENGFRAHIDDIVEGMETGASPESRAESRAARRRASRRREHAAVEQLR